MFDIVVGPPTALTNWLVAHPEHSPIGIVGFCARMDLRKVIVSGPGVRPRMMTCGLAFSRLSTCGVSFVEPGLTIWLATTWKPFFDAWLCMYGKLLRPPGVLSWI